MELNHHQLKQHLTTTPTSLDPQPLSHLLPPPSSLLIHQPKLIPNTHQQVEDNKINIFHYQLPLSPTSQSFNLSSPPPTDQKIRYKECLKNHAATMGTNVVDGCGEFMPSGKEGTLDSLKCAACQCHRNFHRRDHESASGFSRSVILHLPPVPPPHHPFHPQPMTVAYGGGGANTESSSDDIVQMFDEMPQREFVMEAASGSNRKRFRTKFSQEQKDKMLEFAEKLGWRLRRQDDEMVDRFCNEVGIRRQVLKVWMHNNKNAFKKLPDDLPNEQQLQPQQYHVLHPHQQQIKQQPE